MRLFGSFVSSYLASAIGALSCLQICSAALVAQIQKNEKEVKE